MGDIIEKELVKRATSGVVEAFEQLIIPYQKKVYNIALNYSKNHDDAEELSQEAFVKAFRSINGFKGQSSFSTWLFRITTNLCIDYYRKNSNINYVYIDEEFSDEDNSSKHRIELKSLVSEPSKSYLQKELREELQEALNSIHIELKTVVVLRDIHGFCYDEISKILGVPLGTIKSRLNRGRQMLKAILSKENELFYKRDV